MEDAFVGVLAHTQGIVPLDAPNFQVRVRVRVRTLTLALPQPLHFQDPHPRLTPIPHLQDPLSNPTPIPHSQDPPRGSLQTRDTFIDQVLALDLALTLELVPNSNSAPRSGPH